MRQFDIASFQQLMDTTLADGGAKWDLTIYQIIFDPRTLNLYIKTIGQSSWTQIPLAQLFKTK